MRAMLEFLRRFAGSFGRSRPDADLEEELRLHSQLDAEHGPRRGEAAQAGAVARPVTPSVTQAMDRLRDQRGLPWLDALRADLVFGCRQIARHRITSVSAVLSLGLAMGATLAAFRLVDAVLLRPLPVADPSRLFVLTETAVGSGDQPDDRDDFDYPTYKEYRDLLGDQADVMVIGMAARRQMALDGGELETVVQQFVSGNVFASLGLRPMLGRAIGMSDDEVPGGHPIVVLTHDYWRRRFHSDPTVVGRTFRMGGRIYEIVGVLGPGFTGTEPGFVTDFFVPSMMNPEALDARGWSWFRIWLRPKTGVDAASVEARLDARFREAHLEYVKTMPPDTPPLQIAAYLSERLRLAPAGAGASGVQKSFRQPLWIVAALAAMLLMIACANVANLLLGRAVSRRVEMALRLSIGAARRRLVQLLLIESAVLALVAAAVGALFAWWAAPFVVSMLAPPDRPVRLILELDWRTLGTATALTLAVTLLFGLAPALRASAAAPHEALKATRAVRGPRRLTDALVAAQMTLCVFLLVGASLFVGTFDRLQNRPLGFAADGLVHLIIEGVRTHPREDWIDLATSLRGLAGVESAAAAGWAPLTGNRWRSSITVPGRASDDTAPHWVSVAPGYFETMRMRLLEGREFRAADRSPGRDEAKRPIPGVAVVNQAFARAYFDGRSPVGRRVVVDSSGAPMEIVGLVADAVYFSVREPMSPAVFVPLESREGATMLVRTEAGAGDLRGLLRREIVRLRPDMLIREAIPFEALVTQQMIRERLLAALSMFFAGLALILAVVGLFGVLSYAVTCERREIGLRMALGAGPARLVTRLTGRLLGMVLAGALVGLIGGVLFGRFVGSLLFEIAPTDPAAFLAPLAALAAAATLAVVPPAIRAVGIDPAQTIKSEA